MLESGRYALITWKRISRSVRKDEPMTAFIELTDEAIQGYRSVPYPPRVTVGRNLATYTALPVD